VLPDYNEIKQGYVQPPSSVSSGNNSENSKRNPPKQQQVEKISYLMSIYFEIRLYE
jgi:hypothetical protein